jgi:uncharacterized membrane protein
MSLVFLGLAVAALWINLLGAGLAGRRLVDDYPIARVAGVLAACLACFFLEHLAGWGPHPPLLPLTTALSVWLIWRDRRIVVRNWGAEVLFAAGFCYCFLWRYASPDIDDTGEKMPNLMLIESYMRGTKLPAPDLWLPPFRANFYYSFQHYGASLMGRLLGVGPGVSYHLAYCTLVGFIAVLMGSCVARLCDWRPGRLVCLLSLLVGGSGSVVAAHVLLVHPGMFRSVRFLGSAIEHDPPTWIGARVLPFMDTPGRAARDLPMEPMSYVLINGDYHPPLAGFLLLALASTLIAAQATGAAGRRRAMNHALLAGTVPLALISNAWVFPLLLILVGGWFAYRLLSGEQGFLIPALAGLAAVTILEYPYLIEFTQQAITSNAAMGLTQPDDRTPWLGWCLTFWPVAGILALGLLNREQRSLTLFLIVVWTLELAATEFLYNHDVYGGVWNRFNSTLKWWGWVYAGIILTLGAKNLGSGSWLCRYGTVVLLVPSLVFAADLHRCYNYFERTGSEGFLAGSAWLNRDPIARDMVIVLAARPDGVALESGIKMENTESPAITLFAGKQSLLGWPWHETTWRGAFAEIRERLAQTTDFYEGKLADPLDWLLHNNVRYVIWLPRDCVDGDSRFGPLNDKIKARYFWHELYQEKDRFMVGFWELIDSPPKRGPGA